MPIPDLRRHLSNLEKKGLLRHVAASVDKDWELSCIMREVIRQPKEKDRYCVVFDSIKGYNEWKVVSGAVGASTYVYAEGMGVPAGEILRKWCNALTSPIKSQMVSSGPVKENIIHESDLDITRIPFPTWTPTKDAGPYDSAGHVITRDPETGRLNVGNYRKQIKSKNRTGILVVPFQHIGVIYSKYEKMNKPMPVAVAIGNSPSLTMAATAKVPFGVDEFEIAGAIGGEPFEVTKCETSDLPVPANAELVIEGEVPPGVRELEGPFGEYTGYMARQRMTCVLNVKCVTFRNNPILQTIISQKPPSESMILQGIALEAKIYKHLVYDFGFPVKDVFVSKDSGMSTVVVSIKNEYAGLVKQVQQVALSAHPAYVKTVVVIDDDVDIRNPIEREWGIAFRVQADRDIEFVREAPSFALDPSIAPHDPEKPPKTTASKMMIDATKKWAFPDVSLPPQEYLTRTRDNWSDYGLPELER